MKSRAGLFRTPLVTSSTAFLTWISEEEEGLFHRIFKFNHDLTANHFDQGHKNKISLDPPRLCSGVPTGAGLIGPSPADTDRVVRGRQFFPSAVGVGRTRLGFCSAFPPKRLHMSLPSGRLLLCIPRKGIGGRGPGP